MKKFWKEFSLKICLTSDAFVGMPLFLLIIWISPDHYVDGLEKSGAALRKQIEEWRAR